MLPEPMEWLFTGCAVAAAIALLRLVALIRRENTAMLMLSSLGEVEAALRRAMPKGTVMSAHGVTVRLHWDARDFTVGKQGAVFEIAHGVPERTRAARHVRRMVLHAVM